MFLFVWFSFRIEIPPYRRRENSFRFRQKRLLLLVHDFGVNDWSFFLALLLFALRLAAFLSAAAGLRTAAFRSARFFRRGLVKLRRNALPDFVEFVAGGFDRRAVAAFQRFLRFVNGSLHLALIVARDLVSVVLKHFLGAIDQIGRASCRERV